MVQIELLTPAITGTFEGEIVEVPSNAPINTIPASSSWRIDCTWFLDPPGAVVGGSWRLQAIVEGGGSAPEFETPPITIPIDGRVGPVNPYTASIQFPAPQPVGTHDTRVLEIKVALSYRTVANRPGPLAAFLNVGALMVFKDA